jgi:hypothetical protein
MSQHSRDVAERWFLSTGGGGLILPDGWFGQPYATTYRVTFMTVRPLWMVLELDGRLLLTIREPATVRLEDRELVIGGFTSCVLDSKGVAEDQGHVRMYGSGEVRLVAPAIAGAPA